MIRAILLCMGMIFLHPFQDVRVVTYSTGTINTDSYKGLSFWIKDDAKAYIRYAHGLDSIDIDLVYQGPVTIKGEKGFLAVFPAPDTSCFFITQQGEAIKVADRNGNNSIIYPWEDEHKTGDVTIANCNICAANVKEATKLMKDYFFR
jgi:hypothetical protein